VLVHSPLVGPATWGPVAGELAARGFAVVVPRLVDVADARPPRWRACVDAVRVATGEAGPGEVVLVGHSGAGPLLPAAGEALAAAVAAYVFVDAAVPPVEGAAPSVPPEFVGFLVELAGGGDRLPPWSEWWGPEAMAELVPDDVIRRRIESEVPRLPLGYFEERVPVPPAWTARPAAYLRLSAAYAADAAAARDRGWAVDEIDAGHLHLVVDPAGVTDRLLRLLDQLGVVRR
jgi:hypothetical protein